MLNVVLGGFGRLSAGVLAGIGGLWQEQADSGGYNFLMGTGVVKVRYNIHSHATTSSSVHSQLNNKKSNIPTKIMTNN